MILKEQQITFQEEHLSYIMFVEFYFLKYLYIYIKCPIRRYSRGMTGHSCRAFADPF